MKIKHSLNVIILVGILLFSIALFGVKPVDAAVGYNNMIITMNPDPNSNQYGVSDDDKKVFKHYIDPNLISIFTDGIDKTNKYMNMPVPVVIRSQGTDSRGNTAYIDDDNPDAIYIDSTQYTNKTKGANPSSTRPDTYKKQCSNSQSSIIFYIPMLDMIQINTTVNAKYTLLDQPKEIDVAGKKVHFLSNSLKDASLTDNLLVEYCYNSEIEYDGQIFTDKNVPGVTFSRKVIGNGVLSKFQAFPPRFAKGQEQFIAIKNYNAGKGTPLSNIDAFTTSANGLTTLNQGIRYGEFQIQDYNNPLNCALTNPIVSTDIFGHKIKGVDTALGCLPGSFEGIFTIVLRIAIGISAAALLILIIFNGINLMQSNNNPEVIKKLVKNISRGIMALILIIGAVVFLNFVGVKILDLTSLGSIGIEQVVGK